MPQEAENDKHKIGLHIPGILRLLSENLYSDPRVALRELLQNAYDSCRRRALEDTQVRDYEPHIDITLNPQERTIAIKDNGSGLTESEIHTYLATVGRSYTSELRSRLASGESVDAEGLIGQFGLGLLSAFTVANRVEMLTQSYKPDSQTWHWSSDGSEYYRLEPAVKRNTGTSFILHLKLEGEFLLNPTLMTRAVLQYADFLPVKITINGGDAALNRMNAPWHVPRDGMQYHLKFIADQFDVHEPLTVVVLHDHVETSYGVDGSPGNTTTVPLRGVLFVPVGSVLSTREFGDVWVYVRRMFVTDDEKDLLPRWAKFVRGVVSSPMLHLTASREQLRRDETFYAVQQALESQLLKHFTMLASESSEIWQNIVYEHNDLIKGWALESPVLFDSVADIVTFETSRGRQTLPAYLEYSGGRIYYFEEESSATQEITLYEAQGLAAINASRFAEEDFLKEYARRRELDLFQLQPGSDWVFDTVDEEVIKQWEFVISYFSEQGIDTRVVSFDPASIPAILVYPPGSEFISKARNAINQGEIGGPLAGLIEEYLRLRDPLENASRGTIHLNASNSLMKKLVTLSPDLPEFTAALEIIYHNAEFFAGRSMTAQQARQSFDMISYSVEQLISGNTRS